MQPQPIVSPRALAALRAGRLIEAIKIIREENRLSLAESKRLIDEVREAGVHAVPDAPELGDEMPLQALLALREGDLIEAIRQYRARSGAGLKDARQAVRTYLVGDPLLQRQHDAARAERSRGLMRKFGVGAGILLLVGTWLAFRSGG